MATVTGQPLLSQGRRLETSPSMFGELRESSDVAQDIAVLKRRMQEDGYVFLRGYLNRDEVVSARRFLLERLHAQGGIRENTDILDGVLNDPQEPVWFLSELTRKSPEVRKVLFEGPMIAFFEQFLGGPVRPFDFIWLRTVRPGKGTKPHGDSVFMNRGTTNLFTAWTPLGDIDTQLGGLIVLENSHRIAEIRETYGVRDVDTYCLDQPDTPSYPNGPWTGEISDDPVELRDQLGGRWLTADFRMGDLLVFGMHTLHASLDNQSADRLRLSTDTRYQLASDPVDERWVGEDPIGHGDKARKGIIC
jgi:hypothetical protein